jgi:hypothetical protein
MIIKTYQTRCRLSLKYNGERASVVLVLLRVHAENNAKIILAHVQSRYKQTNKLYYI